MIPPHAMVHRAVVVEPALVEDRYGGTTKVWDERATRTEYPCWIARTVSSAGQGSEAGNVPVASWTLLLQPDAVIDTECRVEHDDLVFTVSAPPETLRTFRGPHHIRVMLDYAGETAAT